MTGRKTVVGLALLCALAFSAVSVASASAAPGFTAFTCKKVTAGTGEFKDAHCKEKASPVNTGEYSHVAIAVNETTTIRAQNKDTAGARVPATLASTIGGVAIEIKCEIVETTGDIKNVTPTETEMQVHGTELLFHYKNCTVPKPVGQGCVVPGGEITTNPITSTTFDNSTTDNGVIFKPEGATPFVEITFEKCKTAGLNGKFSVTGSVIARASGTTLSTTPADSEKTLKFGEAGAKLTQEQTVKMYNAGTGVEEEGIATTTIP